ncbi:glycosyltransferase family 2 protein [Galbibacter pacificus]|uniref:Glycosyltransferase family 2 protein n=1 Tax=Galbibacter pacificus TaxID=2996052 RepID=A0ABT6FUH9_9FLAO|nr:glycosyltransferase family 2 protein [Galbibacter pacificus]MDG3583605.1 glycosyltransferase family 2 protein [Galbibacter pacificus]MDG3586919.1 glycosyltransferase family 2 protein [Galbibacter pacificus]
MGTTAKLSAVIITYNEINYIKDCVESVLFADEIIVVDSFSTDGTWEYLRQHEKVTSVQHPFENFTKQKSYALSLANNDWIYFFDADERVTPKLQKEIIETINSPKTCDAYWNYRTFMFKNKRLYFSGWQTDKVYRLFKKSKCEFTNERIVHETLKVNGTEGKLKHKLLHFSYKDYHDYKGKMIKYGQLKAKEAFLKGKKWTFLLQYLRPAWKFFNHYIIRLGILDGKKGIIICYLNALGVYERFKEQRRLQNSSQKRS